jgi:hypothetical protein
MYSIMLYYAEIRRGALKKRDVFELLLKDVPPLMVASSEDGGLAPLKVASQTLVACHVPDFLTSNV